MVEKRWLAVFVVTCALGLAVGLDLYQLHVRSVCLCSLPTGPSPEGLQLGTLRLCRGIDILKFDKKSTDLWCFTLRGLGALFGELRPVATGLVTNRRLFRKLYELSNHARWDISFWMLSIALQRLTFDGNWVEQLYSVQPLPNCTTISINAL